MGREMDLAGRRVTVVGLARTGLAAAAFLRRAGAEVTVSDARPAEALWEMLKELPPGVRTELGGHTAGAFAGADLVVPSPGVPRDLPELAAAAARGVPVMSEVELAARFISKPILAVTGTNGKSTTVSLLAAMLAEGGLRAPAVGNIGTPLVTMAGRDEEYDCLAVEISSFQLEWVELFRPRAAAVLNVTDDHLDRYRDFGDYLETKMRIAAVQGEEDALVLNHDDPAVRGFAGRFRGRVVWFSHGSAARGLVHRAGVISADLGDSGRVEVIPETGAMALQGVHNVENVMAAAAVALDYGVPAEAVRRAATDFRGLPHRNELVAQTAGVRWVDDSKGTNVGAVVKSLEGFTGPVILIAGGREKGGSYQPLAEGIAAKVKLLVLIGEARPRMHRELGHLTATVEAGSLEEAVALAAAKAERGDVVLLSPACSSFDMFRDYHHRGEVFRRAVRSLSCPAR